MAEVVVIDMYSPQRHLWCWMQWQIERELTDLFTTAKIRYGAEGFWLIAGHTERITEPFRELWGYAD